MELRIIYGSAGTGKSTYCFNEAAKNCNKNSNTVIITPEQFSFTAETRLMNRIYEKTKSKATLNAEVITFNRMAYRVLNEVLRNANSRTNLTKCGKAMLVYNILDKQKNKLKFLGKNLENIDLSINAINEFKQHGITLEHLQEEIQRTEEKVRDPLRKRLPREDNQRKKSANCGIRMWFIPRPNPSSGVAFCCIW